MSARACAPAGAAMPPTARPPRAAAAGAAPATPSRPAKPSAAATPVTPGSGRWPIPGQRARSSSKDELDLDDPAASVEAADALWAGVKRRRRAIERRAAASRQRDEVQSYLARTTERAKALPGGSPLSYKAYRDGIVSTTLDVASLLYQLADRAVDLAALPDVPRADAGAFLSGPPSPEKPGAVVAREKGLAPATPLANLIAAASSPAIMSLSTPLSSQMSEIAVRLQAARAAAADLSAMRDADKSRIRNRWKTAVASLVRSTPRRVAAAAVAKLSQSEPRVFHRKPPVPTLTDAQLGDWFAEGGPGEGSGLTPLSAPPRSTSPTHDDIPRLSDSQLADWFATPDGSANFFRVSDEAPLSAPLSAPSADSAPPLSASRRRWQAVRMKLRRRLRGPAK